MIVRIIILILFASNIYSQNRSIEIEIFLSKDTVRLFEPIEYCIKISNTSDDTIKTSSYKWRNYTKPKLEIKSKNNPQWVELWHSDTELESECIVFINPNCGIPAKERIINFLPNSSYYIKSIYYPIWKDSSQNLFQESGNYKIRLSPKIKPYKGLVSSSIEKSLHLIINNDDQRFLSSLEHAQLNTFNLFVPWTMCLLDSMTIYKFLKLRSEHPNNKLSDWIEFQNLCRKIRAYKYKIELDSEYNVLVLKQKDLILKMIDNGFQPIDLLVDYYIGNLEYGLGKVYDVDAYFEECELFNEKLKLCTTKAKCM